MPKFKVDVEWSSYCRGYAVYEVDAIDKDEARDYWYDGKEIYREIIRDDTDSTLMGIELIEEPETNRASELEYLRFFFHEADFGPADGDVRKILMDQFKRDTGKELPEK